MEMMCEWCEKNLAVYCVWLMESGPFRHLDVCVDCKLVLRDDARFMDCEESPKDS